MMYLVIDDGQQPKMYICSSDAEMNAVALPANTAGHKIYGFPTEELARAGFPNLEVVNLSKRSGCGKAAVLLLLLGGLGLVSPALTHFLW